MHKSLSLFSVSTLLLQVKSLTLACSLVALISSGAASAENEAACIAPQNLISLQTTDFNDDGIMDKAVISHRANDPSETELYIYMSKPGSDDVLEQAIHKQHIAWTGIMFGTFPSLEVNERGSLVIISANQAIGRDRWQQELTVSYRDNAWKVAGYTYESYDTLKPDNVFGCDVNLLTGSAVVNGKSTKLKNHKGAILLKDWSDDDIPAVCKQP